MRTIKGATDELVFWADFVHSEQFATWLDDSSPTPELDPRVVAFIKKNDPKRVLDVGSGVVSILRGTVPADRLTATDLLAEDYKRIFDYAAHKITPPASFSAETLPYNGNFDVVHMRNALDHSQDITEAWNRLKAAVRVGGLLIVAGFEREGTFLRGLGMHQWDLYLDRGALSAQAFGSRCGNPLPAFNFKVLLADTIPLSSGRSWITWVGVKYA